MCREPGRFQVLCKIPKIRLYIGNYTLKFYFSEPPGGEHFQTVEGICPFEVVMYGRHREFEWQHGTCSYLEDCDWQVINDSRNRIMLKNI